MLKNVTIIEDKDEIDIPVFGQDAQPPANTRIKSFTFSRNREDIGTCDVEVPVYKVPLGFRTQLMVLLEEIEAWVYSHITPEEEETE